MAIKEVTIYRRVVRGLTEGADLKTQRLAYSGFNDYMHPKLDKLTPVLSRSLSRKHNFLAWDLGLDALGTLITKYTMSGEVDKAAN